MMEAVKSKETVNFKHSNDVLLPDLEPPASLDQDLRDLASLDLGELNHNSVQEDECRSNSEKPAESTDVTDTKNEANTSPPVVNECTTTVESNEPVFKLVMPIKCYSDPELVIPESYIVDTEANDQVKPIFELFKSAQQKLPPTASQAGPEASQPQDGVVSGTSKSKCTDPDCFCSSLHSTLGINGADKSKNSTASICKHSNSYMLRQKQRQHASKTEAMSAVLTSYKTSKQRSKSRWQKFLSIFRKSGTKSSANRSKTKPSWRDEANAVEESSNLALGKSPTLRFANRHQTIDVDSERSCVPYSDSVRGKEYTAEHLWELYFGMNKFIDTVYGPSGLRRYHYKLHPSSTVLTRIAESAKPIRRFRYFLLILLGYNYDVDAIQRDKPTHKVTGLDHLTTLIGRSETVIRSCMSELMMYDFPQCVRDNLLEGLKHIQSLVNPTPETQADVFGQHRHHPGGFVLPTYYPPLPSSQNDTAMSCSKKSKRNSKANKELIEKYSVDPIPPYRSGATPPPMVRNLRNNKMKPITQTPKLAKNFNMFEFVFDQDPGNTDPPQTFDTRFPACPLPSDISSKPPLILRGIGNDRLKADSSRTSSYLPVQRNPLRLQPSTRENLVRDELASKSHFYNREKLFRSAQDNVSVAYENPLDDLLERTKFYKDPTAAKTIFRKEKKSKTVKEEDKKERQEIVKLPYSYEELTKMITDEPATSDTPVAKTETKSIIIAGQTAQNDLIGGAVDDADGFVIPPLTSPKKKLNMKLRTRKRIESDSPSLALSRFSLPVDASRLRWSLERYNNHNSFKSTSEVASSSSSDDDDPLGMWPRRRSSTLPPSTTLENVSAELKGWARRKGRQIGEVKSRVTKLFKKN